MYREEILKSLPIPINAIESLEKREFGIMMNASVDAFVVRVSQCCRSSECSNLHSIDIGKRIMTFLSCDGKK